MSRTGLIPQKFNVGMIGVGKLGQPCAEVMAKYHNVEGYDLEHREPENFSMVDSIEALVDSKELIFIAVQTPHDPLYDGSAPTSHLPTKDFDYSYVKGVLTEVNKYATMDQLVVLISTTLPGTVRRELAPLCTNCRFIYNPYLIAMGTVKHDMVNPEMIIIGTEDAGVSTAAAPTDDMILTLFYESMMENDPRYVIGTWDEAESIKIFYNTFISAKLSLVNMIQDVAELSGNINVDVVTKALAESKQRIMGESYMTAGLGDAGPCHPRDNIALRYMAEKLELGYDLFGAIMHSREVQAENLAKALLEPGMKDVCIIGKSYKPGVPYTDGSYSLLIAHYLENMGANVFFYDDNTKDYEIPSKKCAVLIAYWESWTSFAIDDMPDGSTIIDPWRNMYATDRFEVIHYGNTR